MTENVESEVATYHVACHDCEFEHVVKQGEPGILDAERYARGKRDVHYGQFGHDVEVQEVALA